MAEAALIIHENLQVRTPHPDSTFPYYACCRDFGGKSGGYVPWHWHSDVQFVLVLQGRMCLRTGSHEEILQEGEGAFINTNVLHYKEAFPGVYTVVLNQMFDTELISGAYKSVFDRKYVTPVLECRGLEKILFRRTEESHIKILELLKHSYEEAERKALGYEFEVRNALSSVWRLMYREAEPVLRQRKTAADPKEVRIKEMMLFIQENYQDKISLGQIADSANVSERECLRCFKQSLHTTPFTYLLEYRTRMAARQLLETDKSVTEIAMLCGFAGTSYFGKIFKKLTGCSPSAYRAGNNKAGNVKTESQ